MVATLEQAAPPLVHLGVVPFRLPAHLDEPLDVVLGDGAAEPARQLAELLVSQPVRVLPAAPLDSAAGVPVEPAGAGRIAHHVGERVVVPRLVVVVVGVDVVERIFCVVVIASYLVPEPVERVVRVASLLRAVVPVESGERVAVELGKRVDIEFGELVLLLLGVLRYVAEYRERAVIGGFRLDVVERVVDGLLVD